MASELNVLEFIQHTEFIEVFWASEFAPEMEYSNWREAPKFP
jgi:hypothetical protein